MVVCNEQRIISMTSNRTPFLFHINVTKTGWDLGEVLEAEQGCHSHRGTGRWGWHGWCYADRNTSLAASPDGWPVVGVPLGASGTGLQIPTDCPSCRGSRRSAAGLKPKCSSDRSIPRSGNSQLFGKGALKSPASDGKDLCLTKTALSREAVNCPETQN